MKKTHFLLAILTLFMMPSCKKGSSPSDEAALSSRYRSVGTKCKTGIRIHGSNIWTIRHTDKSKGGWGD